MAEIDPYPELHDPAMEEEIELLADLMEAVTEAGCPLRQHEVDHALGVEVGCPQAREAESARSRRRDRQLPVEILDWGCRTPEPP
ncbi:hypothetical protein [Pedococcus sp. 5OH_020]|uniref:hypothetical protein n=1 Tax=Pedococcus sp. 5OH_020 TaxID=2989814 RepID=UPI0022EA0315|nr:hypothetical protein [Pedococcus sp. 5OH_020]